MCEKEMGNCCSYQEPIDVEDFGKYVKNSWDEFVESCCVFDENAYTSYQDICSLFGDYMLHHKPYKHNVTYVDVAYKNLGILLTHTNTNRATQENKESTKNELRLTVGWIGDHIKLNTRLITGIKVVRFCKPKKEQ